MIEQTDAQMLKTNTNNEQTCTKKTSKMHPTIDAKNDAKREARKKVGGQGGGLLVILIALEWISERHAEASWDEARPDLRRLRDTQPRKQ